MSAGDAIDLPIYGCKYRMYLTIFDNDGDLVGDAAGLDTEISKDGATPADASAEATQISSGWAMYYLDLTGTEMEAGRIAGKVKSTTTDSKDTPFVIAPRRLAIQENDTAQAGAAGTVTLASGASDVDNYYVGMYVKQTNGAGDKEARKVISYNGTTKVATIAPDWDNNPSGSTTYDILNPFANPGSSGLTTTDLLTQAKQGLRDYNLDHLLAAAVNPSTEIIDDSAFALLMSDSATADADDYNNTTDSLPAIAAASGSGANPSISVTWPFIPSIDVSTGTIRIGIFVRDDTDDLPTTGEIAPGTIAIHRKPQGSGSWSEVVADTAMSEAEGVIYYDYAFSAANGFLRGDVIRLTFKGQSVTIGANTYNLSPSAGYLVYSWIAETNGLTTTGIADQVLDEILSGHTTPGSLGAFLASLIDNIWDEVMETGGPANFKTARQFQRVFGAFMAGVDADDSSADWSVLGADGATKRLAGTLTAGGKRLTVYVDGD